MIQSETFSGRTCPSNDRRFGPNTFNKLKYFRMIKDLVDEFPFGPSHLYSGSSLELVSVESLPNEFLVHADHSGNLKINKLLVSKSENDGALIHSLDRASETSIKDEQFSKYSRIFGIAKSETKNVIGLKYWESAAVARLKASENNFSVSAEIISRRDLTGKSCRSMSFVDCLESFLTIDSNGSLSLTDFNTNQLSSCWKDLFDHHVRII